VKGYLQIRFGLLEEKQQGQPKRVRELNDLDLAWRGQALFSPKKKKSSLSF
jgi:hypothetical protein